MSDLQKAFDLQTRIIDELRTRIKLLEAVREAAEELYRYKHLDSFVFEGKLLKALAYCEAARSGEPEKWFEDLAQRVKAARREE